ncbi:DUF7940 domain-containing protein [Piscinibacter defluvii]|uniref:DUF7940 domain-containing protein n=1 Tax=Piscinibacter defluvii TaxID=1796922 RepID=UPI000FDF3473|nr:hypothetical protein [Piscinibacter defluvii]
MKLIPQWRRAWRMFSVQAMAAAGVLQVAWETHPEAIKAVVPASWVPWITVSVLLFGIAGRLVKQRGVDAQGDAP